MENAYVPAFTREELNVARDQHNAAVVQEAIAQLWNDVNAVISGAKDYCATTGNSPTSFFLDHPIKLPTNICSSYEKSIIDAAGYVALMLGLDRTKFSNGQPTNKVAENADVSSLFTDFTRPLLEAGFLIRALGSFKLAFALC